MASPNNADNARKIKQKLKQYGVKTEIRRTTPTGIEVLGLLPALGGRKRDEQRRICFYEFGNADHPGRTDVYIILIGQTGSGKSTLTNAFVNTIFGVKFDDMIRLEVTQLVDEERQQHMTLSQTKWVKQYTIHFMSGMMIPYTLHVVDTPGFDSTENSNSDTSEEQDRATCEQLLNLFKDTDHFPLVHSVCFAAQAVDSKLTNCQQYVFNSLSNLFGRDVESNVCLMATKKCLKMSPPVAQSATAAGIKFGKIISLDNMQPEDVDEIGAEAIFKETSERLYEYLFQLFHVTPSTLRMSVVVISARKELQQIIHDMHRSLQSALTEQDCEIDLLRLLIEHVDKTLDKNSSGYQAGILLYRRSVKALVFNDKMNANCDECKHSCSLNVQKYWADLGSTCPICSHQRQQHQIEKEEWITELVEQPIAEYNTETGELSSNTIAHTEKIRHISKKVKSLLDKLMENNNLLNMKALRNINSSEEFIAKMIQDEKGSKLIIGWERRVLMLEKILRVIKGDIISDKVTTKDTRLTESKMKNWTADEQVNRILAEVFKPPKKNADNDQQVFDTETTL